jgi:arsenite/tail-anchored protein-transporting ATPase
VLAGRLSTGARWTLVGGKGGVGKTTVAGALGVELAFAGHLTLLVSTDPAHSLGDVLDLQLGPEPVPVPGVPRLHVQELDADHERAAFLERYRAPLLDLLDRSTYLERSEIDGILGLALPGADELAAALRLAELCEDGPWERVVVDTAPTGHALRMLAAPALLARWTDALLQLSAVPDVVARAFGGRPPTGGAGTEDLRSLRERFARAASALRDPEHTRFLIVTTAEPAVVAESARLRESLGREGIAVGGVVVNRVGAGAEEEARAAGAETVGGGGDRTTPVLLLPRVEPPPRGVDALAELASRSAAAPPTAPAPAGPRRGPRVRAAAPFEVPADRRLYLVIGKGGVGKTTVASALAARLADAAAAPVLLLSTDPAGSLGEAWATAVGASDTEPPGSPRSGSDSSMRTPPGKGSARRTRRRPRARCGRSRREAGPASIGCWASPRPVSTSWSPCWRSLIYSRARPTIRLSWIPRPPATCSGCFTRPASRSGGLMPRCG